MKGICFIEPLFHRVVKGEKTQTRRIIDHFGNKEHYGKLLCHWGLSRPPYLAETGEWRWELQTEVDDSKSFIIKPKYKVGETVYLKEPYILYQEEYQESKTSQSGIQYAYKFGNHLSIEEITGKSDSKWKNKLFMPESAARYFIKITGMRAERLQDISNVDCRKEGVNICKGCIEKGCRMGEVCAYPSAEYRDLINKINGKGTWAKNPFVWVYDFELINK